MAIRPGERQDPAYKYYRTFWSTVDWLFPPRCAGCEKLGSRWCLDCMQSTHQLKNDICVQCGDSNSLDIRCKDCTSNPPYFVKVRSYSELDGRLRDAIIKLKYQRNISLGENLSKLMVSMMMDLDWKVDVVIPVPLGKIRRIERGYNQAEALSRPLAWNLNHPHEPAGLERIRDTYSQVGLSKRDRSKNVKGAFKADSNIVKGRNILLIDDVITTGATMNACARALMNANAKEVYGLSLARAKDTRI